MLDELVAQFKATTDQKDRIRIIEQIAESGPRADVCAALMALLTDEPVEDPKTRNPREPDGIVFEWRHTAYKALVDLSAEGEAFSFICHAAKSFSDEIKIEAIHNLVKYFPRHPETLNSLMRFINLDETRYVWERVEKSALWNILELYPDRPEIRVYAVRAATGPYNSWPLQVKAIGALAEHHAGHPATRPLLEDLAKRVILQDVPRERFPRFDYNQVSPAAAMALATAYPGDQESFELMANLATHVDGNLTATGIFKALLHAHLDRPETIPLVMGRARHAVNENVRWSALHALTSYASTDSRVLSLLLERATEDEAWSPRSEAIRGLGSQYADNKNVEALIIDRANSDPSDQVRDTAIGTLGKNFSWSTAARDCLINIARGKDGDTLRVSGEDLLSDNMVKPIGKAEEDLRINAADRLFIDFEKDPVVQQSLRQLGYIDIRQRMKMMQQAMMRRFAEFGKGRIH